jgi:hypothetical protein
MGVQSKFEHICTFKNATELAEYIRVHIPHRIAITKSDTSSCTMCKISDHTMRTTIRVCKNRECLANGNECPIRYRTTQTELGKFATEI